MLRAIILFAVWQATAFADEPAESETTSSDGSKAVGDEIVVFSELDVARKRRALEQRIRAVGYKAGVRKENRTIYRPETAWKPTVVVYDDGFVVMKRSRIRFEPWVKGRTKAVWLSCIPPFSLMCIKLGGQVVSPARLTAQKERTLNALDAPLDAWQEAIASNATDTRLHREIPAELDALWTQGIRMDHARGAPLATPEERRAAILAFWEGRACTPEGAAAREVAALFLEYEVQPSPFPATVAEIREANASQTCEDAELLPIPEGSPSPPAQTPPGGP